MPVYSEPHASTEHRRLASRQDPNNLLNASKNGQLAIHTPKTRAVHLYCNFNVARLMSARTIAMIQKRIVIFDSSHPRS